MVSADEIKHVAHLARLELKDQEVKKYSQDLSAVVDYIDQLKEVDTTNVEPTAQVTGLINKTRDDQVDNWLQAEKGMMIEQAKAKTGEEIRIKRVLN